MKFLTGSNSLRAETLMRWNPAVDGIVRMKEDVIRLAPQMHKQSAGFRLKSKSYLTMRNMHIASKIFVRMVLDHGHIIERGNHEKLIAEKGTYYQLYTGAFELE